MGCPATANHLGPQGGLERYTTMHRNYLYATADQINRRCKIKPMMRWPESTWDDGTKKGLNDGKRASCCTQYYPNREKRKFSIWISNEGDDWKCIAHEECHIEIFEAFGMNGNHGSCANFGQGGNKRMKYE